MTETIFTTRTDEGYVDAFIGDDGRVFIEAMPTHLTAEEAATLGRALLDAAAPVVPGRITVLGRLRRARVRRAFRHGWHAGYHDALGTMVCDARCTTMLSL